MKHTSIYIITVTIFTGLQRDIQVFDGMREKNQYLKETGTDTMGITWYCLFSLRWNWAKVQIDVRVTDVFFGLLTVMYTKRSWERQPRGWEQSQTSMHMAHAELQEMYGKDVQGRLRHRSLQLLATLFKAPSKDPRIFVAEKQPQGTEGKSGEKKTNKQLEKLLILNHY